MAFFDEEDGEIANDRDFVNVKLPVKTIGT